MYRLLSCGALTLVACTVVGVDARQAPQQTPRFTSAVNMLAVDVRVVDKTGEPILGLLPDDFTVSINHHDRRVVSASLVHFANTPPSLVNIDAPVQLTPGLIPVDSRVFVIAVDASSFSTAGIRPAMDAAQRFVTNLRPNDMVGVYVFPYDRPNVDVTHDHRAVQNALSRLIGRRDDNVGQYHLRPSEILDITAGDKDALQRVVSAECRAATGQLADSACPGVIGAEANMAAAYFESDAAQRMFSLGLLLQDLGRLPGRKTVVVVSGGLLAANRAGARPDVQGFMTRLGEQAARSNVGTYILHIDDTFLETFSAARTPSARAVMQARSSMSDESAYAGGLERLAAETGGTYVPVRAGNGDGAFGRVLRETMAYYLLGVEPLPEDWDGRKLVVQVKTRAKGAVVRALREVIAR